MTGAVRPRWGELVPRVTALVATAATATILLVVAAGLMQVPPGDAAAALWRGSFGSSYAFTSATLVRAIPLVLTGLAVALAFRAGVFNIGAEGQLLAGAAAAAAVPALLPRAHGAVGILMLLVAGAVAGGAWAGIAAWLRRRFDVLEVISTILLNFVALHLVGYLVRGPLQEPLHIHPQTPALPDSLRLPVLLSGSRLHTGSLLAGAAAVGFWWFLHRRAAGFRLWMAGTNPRAAASAGGIDVARVTTWAFLVSGAVAGLAGAIEVTGVTYALYENISPGYGYTAIAVALLARLDPLGIVVAGVLFGALEAGGAAMQRDAGVPSALVHAITAMVILGMVVLGRRRVQP